MQACEEDGTWLYGCTHTSLWLGPGGDGKSYTSLSFPELGKKRGEDKIDACELHYSVGKFAEERQGHHSGAVRVGAGEVTTRNANPGRGGRRSRRTGSGWRERKQKHCRQPSRKEEGMNKYDHDNYEGKTSSDMLTKMY